MADPISLTNAGPKTPKDVADALRRALEAAIDAGIFGGAILTASLAGSGLAYEFFPENAQFARGLLEDVYDDFVSGKEID